MTELFEKSIRVLELPQLLERLSQKAVSEAAKERAAPDALHRCGRCAPLTG